MKNSDQSSSLPLQDIKVLELGQLLAGPYCGQVLGDFGAEVIKVEPPKIGDAMRQWGVAGADGDPVWWNVISRNKKSMSLNLREPEGQEIIRKLIKDTDILIENFRPGTMEKWGLDYETLSTINPGLIMVRVSGFGQDGPYASRAGYASVCEAMGGLRYICGSPDQPPVRVGISIGDTLAGLHGALGAMVAMHHRDKTGVGQVVDSAIFESVLAMMESLVPDYAKTGKIRERSGSVLPGIAPSNAYPTLDKKDVIIGANQDSVFSRLCVVIGKPELIVDPDYASHQTRGTHQKELDDIISAWTRKHDATEIVIMMEAAGVPSGLIYRAPEMLEDPHFKARQSITNVPDRFGNDLPMQNVFPKLSATPGKIQHVGPTLGEHTENILTDRLGLSQSTITELNAAGII
jgi:crotonobetainyl-CoA:carnitine CoA-transferase CaiB-like acyl-CoA transferase